MKTILACLALTLTAALAENPVVEIKTSAGVIKAELFIDQAPGTVKNFLNYVKKGHYNGTIFHRVIKGFMIQGGGFAKKEGAAPEERPTDPPIKNESENGLKNDNLTLAMARRNDPHSATSQFFINVKDNNFLNKGDAQAVSPDGYCVFGKVVEGADVVKKIEGVTTGRKQLKAQIGNGEMAVTPMRDVPQDDVVIESVSLAGGSPAPKSPEPGAPKESVSSDLQKATPEPAKPAPTEAEKK